MTLPGTSDEILPARLTSECRSKEQDKQICTAKLELITFMTRLRGGYRETVAPLVHADTGNMINYERFIVCPAAFSEGTNNKDWAT